MDLDRHTIAMMKGYSKIYITEAIADLEKNLPNCAPEIKQNSLALIADYKANLKLINDFEALFPNGMIEYKFKAKKRKGF